MGATASSSSSSTALPSKKYDVFISFRGEDTRDGFISHLRAHLRRQNIEVFVDDRLDKGGQISTALIQAIQDSYIFVIVFSKNYASSKWCLDELTEILECSSRDGQVVIPVFYEIDPSDVRKQAGSYMEAFMRHEQELENNLKLQKWKVSLAEAANLAGWHSQNFRDQDKFIENIVDDIVRKLDHRYQPGELQGLIGIEESCEQIAFLLSRVPIVGIWGMGGIGKTTIAKAVFAKVSFQYEGCCFLENVREKSEKWGLNYLRYKLLSELLKMGENPLTSAIQVIGSAFNMRRLSKKKTLIVLDDVTSSQQLEYLARDCNCLRQDSRVIITSRDKHLLATFRNVEIYEVKPLKFLESLELFSLNAFHKNYPAMGFENLSERVVVYSQGIPLALKVLGSYLYSKTFEEWESALLKLKKFPHQDILSVLKLSYDALNYEEKEIFLDIACFLNGEQKGHVINLLDSYGFYGAIGIRTLLDKALITISDSKVVMHDLIKEMRWEIIRKESVKDIGRRSRLWNSEEVYDVLKNNKGTEAIEGILLDMSEIRDLHLSVDTFKKMTNLRFLKLYSSSTLESCKVYLRTGIEPFSDKLRYFHWNGYPSPSLQSMFCVAKLVELHMPNSHVRNLWDGVQDLVNLKKLDLHGSKQLMELPDFSKASNLEVVLLYDCSSLCHVHSSLLSLQTLVMLDLRWCANIKTIQSEIHLKSLKYLNVQGCFSLKEFSVSSEEVREFDLSDTALETLTPSIGHCNNIKRLNISRKLKKLPNVLSKLKSLLLLSVSDGRELDTSNLHIIFDGLQSLKSLRMINCIHLSKLPFNISVLSSLTTLALSGSNVESIPASIKHLSSLQYLNISNCRMLRSLPELSPSIEFLEASNCTSMEKVITPRACWMNFTNCVRLDENSLYTILADFHFRIKQGQDTQICMAGNKVPMWSIHRMANASITIEFHPLPDLLGFAFFLIVSHEFIPLNRGHIWITEFECYLEDIEIARGSSYWRDDEYADIDLASTNVDMPYTKLISDHVHLWYEGNHSEAILKAIEKNISNGQLTTSNPKLLFQFAAYDYSHRRFDNAMIKECGVLPIYTSEYENSVTQMEVNLELELGLGNKTKRCRGSSELQPLTHTNILNEFIFQPPPTDISMQNVWLDSTQMNSIRILDRFSESGNWIKECDASECNNSTEQMELNLELELASGEKSLRCQCESEADEQQGFPLAKKFKESSVQPVSMGLVLKLDPEIEKDLDTDHENQHQEEQLCTRKEVEEIYFPTISY